MASPSISLLFIMVELFGLIPKPICCLHVCFGSAWGTSSPWQWLWKEPIKLSQVVLLPFSPCAGTCFPFLSSRADTRSHRRSRAGMGWGFGKAPLGWVGAGASGLPGLGQALEIMETSTQDCRRNGEEWLWCVKTLILWRIPTLGLILGSAGHRHHGLEMCSTSSGCLA